MLGDVNVNIRRTFTLLARGEDTGGVDNWARILSNDKGPHWPELEVQWRVVVLAEAGAGKTHELKQRAKSIEAEGRLAFCIRIENLEDRFDYTMDVGSTDTFNAWLASTQEAWFFLDSVDEARLVSPQAFQNALRAFGARIKPGMARAHIIISSRPYAWQDGRDRPMVDDVLPDPLKAEDQNAGVKVYRLDPLGPTDVLAFAEAWEVPETEQLMTTIERRGLAFMAAQPFDLRLLLAKWKRDRQLGTRRQLMEEFIDTLLQEQNNPAHAQNTPLALDRARAGARLLAAAMVVGIDEAVAVPNGGAPGGIDARAVLGQQWRPNEISALLQSGVFGDIVYGQVRFRHRDMRELLAAQYFRDCLANGASRKTIERMIFRKQYGGSFIAPRMRPILPWLMLFDDPIRQQALRLSPDLALEGGDPASLPLPVRRDILVQTVARIADDIDDHDARDNAAIGRIARPDLADLANELIAAHLDNEDALFFLGRLVWQGEMALCVPALLPIAIAPEHRVWARIAAARAVMTCGTAEQQAMLWDGLNANPPPLARRVLGEVLDHATGELDDIGRLLVSLVVLQPWERFRADGLNESLSGFVGRLPVAMNTDSSQSMFALLSGLHARLTTPPFIERRYCEVSEANAWLIGPTLKLIERLVVARSAAAMAPEALDVLASIPAIHFWRQGELRDESAAISSLIAGWPELNDLLFWHHAQIWQARSEEPLEDIWQLQGMGQLWRFTTADFERVLTWAAQADDPTRRRLAASLAAQLCVQADRAHNMVTAIEATVADDPALAATVARRLAPATDYVESEEITELRQQSAKREAVELAERADWVRKLQSEPQLVRGPPEIPPGVLTNWQWDLHQSIKQDSDIGGRWAAPDWRSLIDEFGVEVAEAFRDAAMAFWRSHQLQASQENSTNGGTIFALTGLEIEAVEVSSFPANLLDGEVGVALNYITLELNGFPTWLEAMSRTRPAETVARLMEHVTQEWQTTPADQLRSSVISRIEYGAPYLHSALVEQLLAMIKVVGTRNHHLLISGLRMLKSGGTSAEVLAELAAAQLHPELPFSIAALWFAVWVDSAPADAIPALEQWLHGMPQDDATPAATCFVLALLGDRSSSGLGSPIGEFQQPAHLLALYRLMHRHIRIEDDIDRSDGGVYSPTARDDAQRARGSILHMLGQCSGKAAFLALQTLAEEATNPRGAAWLARMARNRARMDGDIEPVSAAELAALATTGMVPRTHRQLFDATVNALEEVQHWLEHGHNSPAQTWRRVGDETEMRVLIADALDARVRAQATTGQEHEIATGERPDIWMQTLGDVAPVPVELKLLDMGWTGRKLCERLLNQLAGRYLRDHRASCGVFLLVWQGRHVRSRQWVIDGKRVGLDALANALQGHWRRHSQDFPTVAELSIILIDLARHRQA